MRWLIIWTVVASGVVFFTNASHALHSLTVKGVTYSDVKLIKEYPKSIYISHASGRGFLKKLDLSVEEAGALGIETPIVEPPPVASAPTPWEPDENSAHRSPPKPPSAVEPSQRAPSQAGNTPTYRPEIPVQQYMMPFDPSNVRFHLFLQGLLPLKESEARDLFDGRELSPMSSRCALDAFIAAKVMLGQLPPDQLPNSYSKLLPKTRGSSVPSTVVMGASALRPKIPRTAIGGSPQGPNFMEEQATAQRRRAYDMFQESSRSLEDSARRSQRLSEDSKRNYEYNPYVQNDRFLEDVNVRQQRDWQDAESRRVREMNDATRRSGGLPAIPEPMFP